jgi:hypothetical protein
MKKCHHRFGDSAGIGMALVFMILLVIFPVLLIIQRNAVRESRMSVRDKNIKTAREYAAVMMTDMMRTFASDYNRDVFDPEVSGARPTELGQPGRSGRDVDPRPSQQMGVGQFARSVFPQPTS